MRLVCRRLRARRAPEDALLALDARASARGLPAPAALCGEWFGSRAVLVPSLDASPVYGPAAFDVPDRQPRLDAPAPDGAIGGGWIGYLGYALTDPLGRKGSLPDAVWGWAAEVLRQDREGTWWFEALVPDGAPEPDGLATELDALLTEPVRRAGWTPTKLCWQAEAEHTAAVDACVRAIAAGELFQANICTRCQGPFDGAPAELYAEGLSALHPRRAAYLAGSWGAVVSMSPELFLARTGRAVRSVPIKGTLPRRGPADEALAVALRRSTKDVAENVMITDLVRNDLGRVCEVGSVRVPELLTVRPAPGVWHLESVVEGTLPPGAGDADLLAATFPPGSVTGAPKLRALDLIGELESRPRGVYTGAIGMASPVAGLELGVAIRTLELRAGTAWLGVGGGITAGSDPAAEWQECLHKAAPLETLLASGEA